MKELTKIIEELGLSETNKKLKKAECLEKIDKCQKVAHAPDHQRLSERHFFPQLISFLFIKFTIDVAILLKGNAY